MRLVVAFHMTTFCQYHDWMQTPGMVEAEAFLLQPRLMIVLLYDPIFSRMK